MKRYPTILSGQSGSLMVEALVALLIFAIGILGIVSLQALSVSNSSENRYRITASFLADQLIGQMWVADRTPTSLVANFDKTSSTSTSYTDWNTQVMAQLPAATSEVTVVPVGSSTTQSLVTIKIVWTPPGGTSHNYLVTHEITQFNQ
jgi:type IV pilus assembly protein PilV